VFARLEAKLTQKVKRVLLVEDDDLQRDSISLLIGDEDIEITAVGLAQDALALLRTTVFDCMIIDLKLPDMLGNDLLKRMSTEDICSFPPVIVYTGTQPDPGRRVGTAQVFALDHHQGRAFTRAPAGRGDTFSAQSRIAVVP